jgi:ribosome maturation factor RimP
LKKESREVGITNSLDSDIAEGIVPVIEGMGCKLVELKSARTKKNIHVSVFIYRPSGLSLADCSDVLRTILPKIQLITDTQDIHLEVSSPGIERVLKSDSEYRIFSGRGIKVMLKDSNDWTPGLLSRTDENGIFLSSSTGETYIRFADIRKARLDHTQEGS